VSSIVKTPSNKDRYSHNPYLGLAKLIHSPILLEYYLTGVPGLWFTENIRTDDEDVGGSCGDMDGMNFINERY